MDLANLPTVFTNSCNQTIILWGVVGGAAASKAMASPFCPRASVCFNTRCTTFCCELHTVFSLSRAFLALPLVVRV